MPRILTPRDVSDFRSRLCDVASELFAEVGHTGFNMRELAKRLGVSAMTPYRYFEDKDAILSEVRARAFTRFADWMEERRSGDVDAFTRAYADFAVRQQTHYRLMFDLGQRQDAGAPAISAQERRVRAILAGYASDMVEGKILSGDPELLALVLWSTLHGVATLYLTGKISSREFDTVLSQTIRVLGDSRATPLSRQAADGSPIGDDTFALRAQNVSALMAG